MKNIPRKLARIGLLFRQLTKAFPAISPVREAPALVIALLLAAANCKAVSLVFFDPTLAEGDQISTAGDITSVELSFDLVSGNFKVTWKASPTHPFQGNLVLNLNLGNSRLGGELVHLANSFSSVDSQTELSYAGTASILTTWLPGDRIVTFGNPPQFSTAFASGVVDLDDISLLNRDNVTTSAIITTCFPDLPTPQLALSGTEDFTASGTEFTRYRLSLSNWPDFPPDLFEAAPDLLPCGLNPNASRTWVSIFADGSQINGFCALPTSSDLTNIWFAIPKGQAPPGSVFITLTDRRCGIVYTSDSILIQPTRLTCPAAKIVDGCSVGEIAPLTYSETEVTISLAQLQAEGGDASDPCSIASLSYSDSQVGICPMVVTRTFTLTNACGSSSSCQQIITVSNNTPPALICPPTVTLQRCDLSAISPLVYSTTPVTITLAQLQAAGGNASAACDIASINYQDSTSGSCPQLVVNRTFTVTDVCGQTTSCQQTISLHVTPGTPPVVKEVVVPKYLANLEGDSRNYIPFFTFITCYQQVYAASQFGFVGPKTITQIAFRPDSSQGPFDITLSQVEIRLSTSARQPDGLDFFCVNAGPDEKIVRAARSLRLRSSASGPKGGPRDFDVVIQITPFRYDPAKGNLLLEIRNSGAISNGSGNTFLDASNIFADPVSREWVDIFPEVSSRDTIGLVTKFSFAESLAP